MRQYLDAFGIINMNARLYDPVLGRMLSPDPVLQNPGNSQNFDRYTYAFNNPLKYTDPTGMVANATSGVNNDIIPPSNSSGLYIDFDGEHIPLGSSRGKALLAACGNGVSGIEVTSQASVSFATGLYQYVAENNQVYTVGASEMSNLITAKYQRDVGYNPAEAGATMTGPHLPPVDVYRDGSVDATAARMAQHAYAAGLEYVQGGGVMQGGIGGDLVNYGGAFMNIAGSLAGIAEMSAQAARRINDGRGPQLIAKAMTFINGGYVGTQEVAKTLKSLGAGTKNWGAKLGVAGALLATTDYAYNFNDKNGYEHANYWIGAAITIAAFANPVGAGVGLAYGIGQGVSWFYNGKTLEENAGRSLGW